MGVSHIDDVMPILLMLVARVGIHVLGEGPYCIVLLFGRITG